MAALSLQDCAKALQQIAGSKFNDLNHPERRARVHDVLTAALDVLHAACEVGDGAASAAAHIKTCSAVVDKLMASPDADAKACGFGLAARLHARTPRPDFLAAMPALLQQLSGSLREGDARVVAAAADAAACVIDRLALCLAAPDVRLPAAQALAKLVAAVLHLQRAPDRGVQRHAWRLLQRVQATMPQALKSHAPAVGAAAVALLTDRAPLALKLSAAGVLARLPASAATPEAWSANCRGVLVSAHRVLDALPMPKKDADLAKAALELLGVPATPVDAPWALLTLPPATAPLARRLELLTLLLETLDRALTHPFPTPCPVATSAAVLLVTRLASLQRVAVAGAPPHMTDPAAKCQWQAACEPLANAGLLLLRKLLSVSGDLLLCSAGAVSALLADLLDAAARGQTLASTRVALYDLVAVTLRASGFSCALTVAEPLVACAWAEFYASDGAAGAAAGAARGGGAAGGKRKGARDEAVQDASTAALLRHEQTHTPARLRAVGDAQEAVLAAIAQLLITAGASLPKATRLQAEVFCCAVAAMCWSCSTLASQQPAVQSAPLLRRLATGALEALTGAAAGPPGARLPLLAQIVQHLRECAGSGRPEAAAAAARALSALRPMLRPVVAAPYATPADAAVAPEDDLSARLRAVMQTAPLMWGVAPGNVPLAPRNEQRPALLPSPSDAAGAPGGPAPLRAGVSDGDAVARSGVAAAAPPAAVEGGEAPRKRARVDEPRPLPLEPAAAVLVTPPIVAPLDAAGQPRPLRPASDAASQRVVTDAGAARSSVGLRVEGMDGAERLQSAPLASKQDSGAIAIKSLGLAAAGADSGDSLPDIDSGSDSE